MKLLLLLAVALCLVHLRQGEAKTTTTMKDCNDVGGTCIKSQECSDEINQIKCPENNVCCKDQKGLRDIKRKDTTAAKNHREKPSQVKKTDNGKKQKDDVKKTSRSQKTGKKPTGNKKKHQKNFGQKSGKKGTGNKGEKGRNVGRKARKNLKGNKNKTGKKSAKKQKHKNLGKKRKNRKNNGELIAMKKTLKNKSNKITGRQNNDDKRKCQGTPKKCSKLDGTCVSKGKCKTIVVDNKCKGSSCDCCLSKCFKSSKRKCTKKGGTCKTKCSKKEKEIANGCKGKTCKCCARDQKCQRKTCAGGAGTCVAKRKLCKGTIMKGRECRSKTGKPWIIKKCVCCLKNPPISSTKMQSTTTTTKPPTTTTKPPTTTTTKPRTTTTKSPRTTTTAPLTTTTTTAPPTTTTTTTTTTNITTTTTPSTTTAPPTTTTTTAPSTTTTTTAPPTTTTTTTTAPPTTTTTTAPSTTTTAASPTTTTTTTAPSTTTTTPTTTTTTTTPSTTTATTTTTAPPITVLLSDLKDEKKELLELIKQLDNAEILLLDTKDKLTALSKVVNARKRRRIKREAETLTKLGNVMNDVEKAGTAGNTVLILSSMTDLKAQNDKIPTLKDEFSGLKPDEKVEIKKKLDTLIDRPGIIMGKLKLKKIEVKEKLKQVKETLMKRMSVSELEKEKETTSELITQLNKAEASLGETKKELGTVKDKTTQGNVIEDVEKTLDDVKTSLNSLKAAIGKSDAINIKSSVTSLDDNYKKIKDIKKGKIEETHKTKAGELIDETDKIIYNLKLKKDDDTEYLKQVEKALLGKMSASELQKEKEKLSELITQLDKAKATLGDTATQLTILKTAANAARKIERLILDISILDDLEKLLGDFEAAIGEGNTALIKTWEEKLVSQNDKVKKLAENIPEADKAKIKVKVEELSGKPTLLIVKLEKKEMEVKETIEYIDGLMNL